MSKNYGIVRLDLVKGHAYHYDIDAPIENGVLAEIDYATGKIAPTTDAKKKQVLVASVANLYDSVDESDFRNEVGTMKVRTYELEIGDFYTTTQLDFTGDRKTFDAVAKGDFAYPVVGGKLAFGTTAQVDVPQVLRVLERTTLNGYQAIVVQVESV